MVLVFYSRFVAKSREAAFTFNEGIWVSVKIDLHLLPRLPGNLGLHYGWDRAGWMKTLLLVTCQVTPEVSVPSNTQIPRHFRGVLSLWDPLHSYVATRLLRGTESLVLSRMANAFCGKVLGRKKANSAFTSLSFFSVAVIKHPDKSSSREVIHLTISDFSPS